MVFTPELENAMQREQMRDFVDRSTAYLESLGVALPPDMSAFLLSLVKYGSSIGVTSEIGLVRLANLILGWKDLRAHAPARDILVYPELSGSDRINLLCEMAMFASEPTRSTAAPGLDPAACGEATKALSAEFQKDPRFSDTHPDGMLTLSPRDVRWRKKWLALYAEKVLERSSATQTQVGAISV